MFLGYRTLEIKLRIYRGIKELLSLSGVAQKKGRRVVDSDLGIMREACLVEDQGKILFVGPEKKLSEKFSSTQLSKAESINLNAATVIPAFVEAHTHLVFAGDRSEEFEMRNRGVSYSEIAARGGGILSTVKHTRAASFGELTALAQKRADKFLAQGVTCLESKSGYGLDLASEVKMLQVGRALRGPKIVNTFLGAHAKPSEFESFESYLDYLEKTLLPEVLAQGLADRIDIFIEKGFFESQSAKRLLQKAQESGLKLTVHADQLSLSGGTALALELGAQSADHVIKISDELIQKMGTSQTVAMLLPAADFYLECDYPPARKLIDAGACVAIATDFNPGTSPTQDLSLVGVLARLKMKMTQAEVISAYTFGAATSLGLNHERGSLEVGKVADFVVLDSSWKELFYQVGQHPVQSVYCQGEVVFPLNLKKS